jgi:carboxypeptidase Q
MRSSRLSILVALAAIAAAAPAQGDPKILDRIADEGKNRNQVMKTLWHLTKNIGPRLTGSPQLHRSQFWAMSEFKRYGLTNVHLDYWGDVSVGFYRGPRQVARMVSPEQIDFDFTTLNWMPGTSGMVRGHAVRNPKDMEEFAKIRPSLRGAWVIMDSAAGMRGATLREDDLKKAVDGAGIAGRIFGTADDRVHSSGSWRGKTFQDRPKDIIVFISKPGFDKITGNLDAGRKVELEFDIENRWVEGPIPQYNVVADIVGTEKPDEYVIVGGHLDSWNSPGSEGACDNGTGTVVAMEAARILMATGARPKRTIRFILWTGEEQGLLGSRGYVEKHKDKLHRISAKLNDDGGTNYQGGYQGIESMRPMMERAFAKTNQTFPDMQVEFVTLPRMPLQGSSDHAPFNQAGVPGFFTIEKGRANYGRVWHTQYDRYEEAIPEYLVQSSTNHAIVAYNLAMADTLLPRETAPRPTEPISLDHAQAVGADRMTLDLGCLLHGDHDHHDHSDDFLLEFVERLKRIYRFLPAMR